MVPSKYQAAIYSEMSVLAESDGGALEVIAVAGSGKTTTSVAGLGYIPHTMSCGFFAFNKSIAEELGRRVPANVMTRTFNGFGNSILSKAARRRPKLNAYKTGDICGRLFGKEAKWLTPPISKIIGLLKGHAYARSEVDTETVVALMDHHDIEFNGKMDKLFTAIQEVWAYGLEVCESEIDFDDQIWLPIYYDLPVTQFDLLMVDEVQDLNPVQMELASRASKRIVIVGDPRQSIYGFRGADPEAMSKFSQRLAAKTMPLSICYRCSKNVVRAAQRIVPHIEFSETQIDGVVDDIKRSQFKKQVLPEEFILCRTTAPLVASCMSFIRDGVKATVKGRDIGVNLIKAVDKISCNEDSLDTRSFGEAVKMFRSAEIERLERAGRDSRIQTVEDQCDTLMVFVEQCENVTGIKSRINEIFQEKTSGISHMTMHRSKGLESPRVYILPSKPVKAKKDWMMVQESNLAYVSITRAQQELYYVKD